MNMYNFNQFIEVPFTPDGRSFDGVDCYGLMWIIYKTLFKIELPRYDGFSTDKAVNHPEEVKKIIKEVTDRSWKPIEIGDEQVGDSIEIKILGESVHCGIVVRPQRDMIHVHKAINVTVERYNTGKWKHRIVRFYRHKDMPEMK